jgi:hypothetical protein
MDASGAKPAASGLAERGHDGGQPRLIGVLGGDLMSLSRVTSTGRQLGFGVRAVRSAADLPGLDLLLVDLNRDADRQLTRMAQLLTAHPGLRAIGVGRHTELAGLQPRARAAGAARCVANSGLPQLLERTLGGGPAVPSSDPGESS